jgi:aryl-alcohol dehydrogenase-like predicted oxidoreductase
MKISRRRFLETSAVAAGGLAALPLVEATADATEKGMLPTRTLGRTKEKVSLLGFGLAPLGSDNTTPEAAERIVHFAIDQGIHYLDVAPVYGDPKSKYGNAEMKLKGVLKTRRKEVFLVTKVNSGRQTKAGVLEQLHESLERMGVDHVDAVHIHNLGDFDMEKVFGPDGALAGLKEARKQGLLRFIGASGHLRPARFVTALDTGDMDLVMNALNFADRHTYDFEGLVLPTAKRHGTAVVAMKVLGGAKEWRYDGSTPGTLAAYHERAIRYSLGLPGVACAVIGFAGESEVKQALEVARHFKPLSADERTALLEEGKKLAEARGLYYGPVTG